MPIHDRYARLTPFERSFPDPDEAEARFRAIEEEAAARGADLGDPEAFVMLMAAGRALRDVRGPDEDPERIREHGALLWHAWHFWRHGRQVYLLPGATARWLVEGAGGGGDASGTGWEPKLPASAGYLQLPQHLFWARPAEDETPESVDGLFWTAVGDRMALLPVLGMREDRPGFGVVPIPLLPLADAGAWVGAEIRGDGNDFVSDMPGAELERLYEVRTAGEILKLAARAFRHLDREGREAAPVEAEEGAEDAGDGPRPSRLPWTRIELD
jgi:hypothetical protein